ncbi:hypothetical protein, partial [Rhizobium binae]|uniref:hypothetical protein n=1 Tax=Rhizobium binae TaxID=1138190 RepID=UPI001C83DDCA
MTAKGLVPGHIGSAGAMKLRQENGVASCIGGAFGETSTPYSVIPGLDPLLSGLNLVDKAHGVDSTRIRMFGDNPGHERGATPCGMRIAS